jgi:hypothetical protein
MKPAFVMVSIAMPRASRRTAGGIAFSGISKNRSTIDTARSMSASISARAVEAATQTTKKLARKKSLAFT